MSSETPAASGTPEPSNEIILAKWSDRFFAWLIDFIIVNVAVAGIFSAAPFRSGLKQILIDGSETWEMDHYTTVLQV